MPTDTKLNQLIINQLTQEQYDEAKAAGTLSDTELYITDSDDDALTNNKISNCITEIPQDIKLELNNGTLTLKAGSKVYVPNEFESDGTTPKFDVVTTESDLNIPKWDNTVPGLISITSNREIWISLPEQHFSGSSAPTSQWALWYDTTNNKIKSSYDAGSSWKEGYCLPIAICTSDSSKWTSINQVFNGFGYIGSTVFVLPGVKGLIPNGRNADGSLKNIEITVSKVMIKTIPSNYGWHYCLYSIAETKFDVASEFYIGSVLPNNALDYSRFYNINTNEMYLVVSGKLRKVASFVFPARIEHSNSSGFKITSIQPLNVFHALDYNDKFTISGWSMPSTRYIDLTAAHGQNYIAPANGYFSLQGYMTGATFGNTLGLYNQTKKMGMTVQTPESTGSRRNTFLPASKGDTVTVYCYSATVTQFSFIYAEGENS